MEELISKLAPDELFRLEGATEGEIEQIERLWNCPLPKFYRWFLMRMGRSMGPFAHRRLDHTVSTVLSAYEEEFFIPDERYHLLAVDSDEMMPLHLVYDLDYPAREDARVVRMEALGADVHVRFETFREMFAWTNFMRFRIKTSPQHCRGRFAHNEDNVLLHLNPVMQGLGFVTPASIPTGPLCSLHERADAAMITHSTPGAAPRVHAFNLGGKNAATIRRILGEITNETELDVTIVEWTPPLR
jgi:hypothetical protein